MSNNTEQPYDFATADFDAVYRGEELLADAGITKVPWDIGEAQPGVIEFERTGRRYFGARVPDFTLGKQLMTIVKEKVPGSTPELVCHDPPVLRKLALDLTSASAAVK